MMNCPECGAEMTLSHGCTGHFVCRKCEFIKKWEEQEFDIMDYGI